MTKVLETVTTIGIMKEGDNGPNVKVLQEALRRAGHELVVDGNFGATTRAAVERFQATVHIAADGMVGPITATYLDGVKPIQALPQTPLPSVLHIAPWLTYMRALTGTKEIPGARSNPLILAWVRSLGARYPKLKPNINWYTNDDVPWCGLGAAEAVGECVPGYPPPDAPLGALNWSTWGQSVPHAIQGAIAVKRRKGGGHVTIVEGQSANGQKLYCRGANQHDMINVAEYSIADFSWFRWPKEVPLPPIKATITSIAALGHVATNVSEA